MEPLDSRPANRAAGAVPVSAKAPYEGWSFRLRVYDPRGGLSVALERGARTATSAKAYRNRAPLLSVPPPDYYRFLKPGVSLRGWAREGEAASGARAGRSAGRPELPAEEPSSFIIPGSLKPRKFLRFKIDLCAFKGY